MLAFWGITYMTAFLQPCPGHKRKNGLTSKLYAWVSRFWTTHPSDRVFGSRTDAFSTQFTGFSICHHPMYDNKHMLKVVQHATASASNNQEATTYFLLLPDCMENSTNAFHQICINNKNVCTITGNILKLQISTSWRVQVVSCTVSENADFNWQ